MDRRAFTRGALATLAAAGVGWPLASALGATRPKRPYRGPNVVIVRFGGGVRRRETIEPDTTYAPYLVHRLAPRGVLFENMVMDDAPHVVTSHGQGTLYLLTGRYDELVNQEEQVLGERFEPPAPTLFESAVDGTFALTDATTLVAEEIVTSRRGLTT